MPIPTGPLTDVKEGFELLPAGSYTVEVLDAEETETSQDAKNPGVPMVKLTFQVVDDPEWEGRKLFNNLVFTDKAMGMVKANLRALGYTDEDFADAHFQVDADELVERRCIADVKVQIDPRTKNLPKDQQEKQNSIRRLRPITGDAGELPG